MRIALAIRHFHETRGGVERFCFMLARALAQAGHDVHVFAEHLAAQPPSGVRLFGVTVSGMTSSARPVSFSRAALRAIELGRFDVVHALSRLGAADVFRLADPPHRERLAPGNASVLKRLWSHVSPRHRAMLHLEDAVLSPASDTRIVTNSERTRDDVLRQYNIPPSRVRVIRNCVDAARFSPGLGDEHRAPARQALGIPDDAFTAVFVSNDFTRKGLACALRAIALPRSGPVHLVVVGRDDDAPFRRMARSLRVTDAVHFADEAQDVERYYGAADCLVLPTRQDPFANVTLEALASGLPVVTTSVNGASEIVSDGVEGFIIEDAGDAHAVADALGRLADDDTRARMSAAAAKAASVFTPEATASAYTELYEEIVDLRAQRRREAGGPIEVSRAGHPYRLVQMNVRCADILERAGIETFEQLWDLPGTMLKELPDRSISTARIDERAVFVKRHRQPGHVALSPAFREFHNYCLFRDADLATAEPVAVAQHCEDGWTRSVLVTTALGRAESLESFLPCADLSPEERSDLIARLAGLARRMHGADLHHQDFYFGHIFREPAPDGAWRLVLVDLGRAGKGAPLAERWRIKDLGQLAWSARELFTRADFTQFFVSYFGVRELELRHERMVKRIMDKARKIQAHAPTALKRRAAATRNTPYGESDETARTGAESA